VVHAPDVRRGVGTLRLLLGAVLVLALSGGAGAVLASGEIDTLRHDLDINPPLAIAPGTLASANYGAPQTLLLVGDDQRSLTGAFKYYSRAVLPHSNEMLLVRFDPSKPWISMMSIPRELLVTIYPPHAPPVQTRFNYAYTAGGIPLLVSTIKRVLGLPVNHVIVITFGRFQRAVDELGCVYSTIDRRYFHVNVPGGEQYQQINLQPGYQKLCGDQALQFVSYRHDDTSLVRDARNQSFLLDVKKQYGSQLAGNIHKFERIFGQAVQTDPTLHTYSGVLDLIGTLISSSGLRVRQVQFQANLLASYDTASPQQIAASVHSFLDGGSPLPGRPTAPARAGRRRRAVAALALVATSSAEQAQARLAAAQLPFALELPTVQDRAGAITPASLRDYLIHAPGGAAYPAYVAVFSAGQLGQFYDVQGMTWLDAPQFRSPDQTVWLGGRSYRLYYEGQNLQMVAWNQRGAVYWVRNSLTDAIANSELLAIAQQTRPLAGVVPATRVVLNASRVPRRQAARPAATDTLAVLGSIGGLVTVVAVPLFALALLRRRRLLGELRAHVHASVAGEARARSVVDAAGIPEASPAAARSVARAAARGSEALAGIGADERPPVRR
jgi:LCP family protein required for cell wall assembly